MNNKVKVSEIDRKVKRQGLFRPGNLVLACICVLLLMTGYCGYGQVKGPFSEQEINEAQTNATAFQNGTLEVQQGQLLNIRKYFLLGKVYTVKTDRGQEDLISFITPDPAPKLTLGGKVEWVGLGNYASSFSDVYTDEHSMDGEITSLERITPKNDSLFYCVVHTWENDLVQRFIVSNSQLADLHTLNSVRVTFHSPGSSNIHLVANADKVAKGFIRDLWLTTEIHSLELERSFDFTTYPYYISVAPSVNPKYTWTFYLTKEQREQVKLGNMVEIHYNSSYPAYITVTAQEVDPALLTERQ
ncbi:hypothetical protein [Desulfosporosinus fructosivorans]